MAKYIISKIEVKQTSTGKTKADVALVDPTIGKETPNVTIWGDFPSFAELAPNSEIEGNLVEKQNGQYLNRTLYPATPKPIAKGSGAINKAMDKKAENIAVAQDRKEQGIILAATMRDATLLTVEWIKSQVPMIMTDDEIKAKWKEWREFLTINFGDGKPF